MSSIEFSGTNGKVNISDQVISNIIGASVYECYGVVGMASKNKFKDGVTDLLGKENYGKGIVVNIDENEIEIHIHVIVSYGVKISEVARSIQERVKHQVETMLDIHVANVDVIVEDVRVQKEKDKDKGKPSL